MSELEESSSHLQIGLSPGHPPRNLPITFHFCSIDAAGSATPRYEVVNLSIELDREDGNRWIAEALELPGVATCGVTGEETISAAPHPPMAHIGSGGGTKQDWLISWPSHFVSTVKRIGASISWWAAPARARGFGAKL
jgi:hypothetical protein